MNLDIEEVGQTHTEKTKLKDYNTNTFVLTTDRLISKSNDNKESEFIDLYDVEDDNLISQMKLHNEILRDRYTNMVPSNILTILNKKVGNKREPSPLI